jgi:hypothetical protein
MRARGQELQTRQEPVREEVYGEFARIQEAEKQAASTITMLALVHRADARLELTPPPPAQEKEIELSPTFVRESEKPKPETAAPSAPEQQVEIQPTSEPVKPEPPAAPQTPEPPSAPRQEIASAKPIAEPLPDDERDFPL